MKFFDILAILPLCAACATFGNSDISTTILVSVNGEETVKASFGEEVENIITDLNLFIFDGNDRLVGKEYVFRQGATETKGFEFTTDKLYSGEGYTFIAFANLGEELAAESLEELKTGKFYLAYPDEISHGIPMSAILNGYKVRSGVPVELKMSRLMAKISLRIDRSKLDPVTRYTVQSVRIGASPKQIPLFYKGKATSTSDVFTGGYGLDFRQANKLNINESGSISEEVHLYILENMQGTLLPGNSDPRTKILPPESPLRELCSYVEIKAGYISSDHEEGGTLTYRFYLGEDASNFDVQRGCHYHITVIPTRDGLAGDPWRTELN